MNFIDSFVGVDGVEMESARLVQHVGLLLWKQSSKRIPEPFAARLLLRVK